MLTSDLLCCEWVVSAYKVDSKVDSILVEFIIFSESFSIHPHPHDLPISVAVVNDLPGHFSAWDVDAMASLGVDIGVWEFTVLIEVVQVDGLNLGIIY